MRDRFQFRAATSGDEVSGCVSCFVRAVWISGRSAVLAGAMIAPVCASAQIVYNPTNQTYYERVLAPNISWDSAWTAAELREYQGRTGNLACITSAGERDFVAANFGSTLPLWLGAHRTSNGSNPALGWEWVSGEAWSFTAWAAGEPNNFAGQEQYLMLAHNPFAWNDCANLCGAQGYIVEYPVNPPPQRGNPAFVTNNSQGATIYSSPSLGFIQYSASGYLKRKSSGGSTSGGFADASTGNATVGASFRSLGATTTFTAQASSSVSLMDPAGFVSSAINGNIGWSLDRDYATSFNDGGGSGFQFNIFADSVTGQGALIYYQTPIAGGFCFSAGTYSMDFEFESNSASSGSPGGDMEFTLQPLGYDCILTGWKQAATQVLPAFGTSAIAFDSARSELISIDSMNPMRTYRWSGTSWNVAATGGPSARTSPGLAFDSIRNQLVLFGGNGLNDLWEWNGSLWTPRPASGLWPEGGGATALAFHSGLGESIALAYNEYGVLHAWSWNGARWLLREESPEPFGEPVGATYDPSTATCAFLFKPDISVYRIWKYGASGWTFGSEFNLYGAVSIAYDPRASRIVLVDAGAASTGGGSGSFLATYESAGSQFQLMSVRSPLLSGSYRASVAFDAARSELVACIPQPSSLVRTLTLTRGSKPIVASSSNASFAYGTTANLSASVVAAGTLTSQWLRSDQPLPANPRYLGTQSTAMSIAAFRRSDTGNYRLRASNECGQQLTAGTLLTGFFSCPGDINFDGLVDDADFVLFAGAYDTLVVPPANEFADVNEDLFVDDADFVTFAFTYDRLLCP